jgi:Ala-tRNA(Pro) deacylase
MPILKKLREHLDGNGVRYEILTHRPAYSAQEVAAAQHVPGREVAKVVVARSGGGYVMAVLPATRRVDVTKLGAALGDPYVRLATEDEFARLFPQCEPGAMPPFGNLFGLPVFIDQSLMADERIVFQAGTHTDTVRLRYADFARLVQPTIADLALVREEAA